MEYSLVKVPREGEEVRYMITRTTSDRGILSLPFDVLEIMFSILAAMDPPRELHGAKSNRPRIVLGWIVFTHVCTSLRNVALELPLLWSVIDTAMGIPWVEAFFIRSQTAPVRYVDLQGSMNTLGLVAFLTHGQTPAMGKATRPDDKQSNLLASNLHRIQHLLIARHFGWGPITAISSLPVPWLETCCIHDIPSHFGSENLDHFLTGALRLTELTIPACISFSWNFTCDNIVILHVTQCMRTHHWFLANNFGFFKALRRMSRLESLSLVALPPAESESDGGLVYINKLRYLGLSSYCDATVYMLSRLRFPSSTRLSLKIELQQPALVSAGSLISVVRDHCMAETNLKFTEATVKQTMIGARCTLGLVATRALSTPEPHIQNLPPHLEISMNCRNGTEDDMNNITNLLFNALPMYGLKSLTLNGMQSFPEVISVFEPLLSVELLCIQENCLAWSIAVLSLSTTAPASQAMLFPMLKQLNFPDSVPENWTELMREGNGPIEHVHDILSRFVRKRRERGAPLREIHLGTWSFTKRGQEELRQLATRCFSSDLLELVRWDEAKIQSAGEYSYM